MSPAHYPSGTKLNGRYELVKLLGQGADGEVHVAQDEYLDTEVALKLMRPKAGVPAEWTEARLLEQLRGDFLLAVHNADVVQNTDIRFIATPVMQGGDLVSAARTVGVDTRTAVKWGVQLAHATERLHGARLLHRDIKPGNAYLDGNRDCFLADLGMATLVDANGLAGPNGTLVTVAPEALTASSPHCTVRSDIYSLGATLFFLLTGDYPVSESITDRARCRDLVLSGERRKVRDLAPHVSQSLSKCVETALALEPSERQVSALAFANQLARVTHSRRKWQMVDHPSHGICMSAPPEGRIAGIDVCAIEVGNREFDVQVVRPSGAHLRNMEQAGVKAARVPVVLREICRKVK